MWEIRSDHPLRKLFAGITENAFLVHVGIVNPDLVDYVSGMLSRFIHVDELYRLRDSEGNRLTELTAMALEAEKLPPGGRTCQEYHRHIGDFALFWTGLFPESVDRLSSKPSKDHLISYTSLGKRSYGLAAQWTPGDDPRTPQVYQQLCEQFELCALGLHRVRESWQEIAGQAGGANHLIQ